MSLRKALVRCFKAEPHRIFGIQDLCQVVQRHYEFSEFQKELDPVLIADLNSFAEARGEAAHLSSRKYRTKQQIDPKEELARVKSIISRLIQIDKAIDKLLLDIK